jgi:hypothetical protein
MAVSLFLLGLYHQGTEILTKAARLTGTLLQATCNYLNGTSNEWYFLPFGFVPASIYPSTHQIEWTYNSYHNTLVQTLDSPTVALKLNWLSTVLHINNKEYVLDDWIRTLTITRDDDLPPALLINCWSISHRVWARNDATTLHIIDNDGESHAIPVRATGSDEWNALLPQQYVREGEDEEGEDEEDEDEEDEKEEVAEEENQEHEEYEEVVEEPLFACKDD